MYGTYEKLALIKKFFVVLCFEKLLWFMTTPSWPIFHSKNKNGDKKVMSVEIDNKI